MEEATQYVPLTTTFSGHVISQRVVVPFLKPVPSPATPIVVEDMLNDLVVVPVMWS